MSLYEIKQSLYFRKKKNNFQGLRFYLEEGKIVVNYVLNRGLLKYIKNYKMNLVVLIK